MMFGRVEATATPAGEGLLHISVTLETGRAMRSVRDEIVAPIRPMSTLDDLAWHADQYAQETIANELALEGWEVIGAGDIPSVDEGAVPRSASYGVRKLSWGHE